MNFDRTYTKLNNYDVKLENRVDLNELTLQFENVMQEMLLLKYPETGVIILLSNTEQLIADPVPS